MKISTRVARRACWGLAMVVGLAVGAWAATEEPVFLRWLVVDDPGDETIRDYWDRAESGELDAPSTVDLGTMVFHRGFTDDALGFYKQALDLDPELFEAWFRIGLIEHSRGNFEDAEDAYRKCLKKRPGHAWCNFYYGLLQEQMGNSTKALEYYENAFRVAPGLADPDVNPEVYSSKLVLAARLRTYDQERFEHHLPLRYMRPNKVKKVRKSYETVPEPTPAAEAAPDSTGADTPEAQPTPRASAPPARPAPPARRVPTRPPTTQPQQGGASASGGEETPYGTPATQIRDTSGEARLMPGWTGLYRISEALV